MNGCNKSILFLKLEDALIEPSIIWSLYETFRILDPFTLTLITVVLLASFFPARGDFVPFFENLTTAAIALLFFMHGAKLSREAIIAGGITGDCICG